MGLEVQSLSFSYGDRAVLHDVSFCAREGQLLSILGPNGVGKSTLFRCVLGLLPGYTGQVRIHGRDARGLSVREMAREIAYIPQSSRTPFHYSVFDMVLMGVTSRLSWLGVPGSREQASCRQALEKVGIGHLERRCYHHLSGGEQQLVLIARALAQDAPVLMLDEPTANLDFGNQVLVLRQLQRLAGEGYTVIQTTHNPDQSYLFSDRILAMGHGGVLADGAPAEVLTAETMEALYGVRVEVVSIFEDQARVCIPADHITRRKS